MKETRVKLKELAGPDDKGEPDLNALTITRLCNEAVFGIGDSSSMTKTMTAPLIHLPRIESLLAL